MRSHIYKKRPKSFLEAIENTSKFCEVSEVYVSPSTSSCDVFDGSSTEGSSEDSVMFDFEVINKTKNLISAVFNLLKIEIAKELGN